MAKIKDIRHRTRRTNGTRSLSRIKNIARHHSATTSGNFDSFWRHWNGTLGWGTGGYHEIILRDGTVELCYDPQEITNGVGGQNSYIYHICVVGNGSFTAEQEKVFDERAKYWMDRLGLPVEAVKGHREFPGQSTSCPGIDMGMVRRRLKLGVTHATSPTKDDIDYSVMRYGQTLSEGMGGAAAKRMQEDLNKLGYPLVADGILGPASDRAIRAFQLANGLTVDGYAGKATQQRITELLNALNKPKPSPAPKPAPDVAEVVKPKEDDILKSSSVTTLNTFVEYLENASKMTYVDTDGKSKPVITQKWVDQAKNGTLTVSDAFLIKHTIQTRLRQI